MNDLPTDEQIKVFCEEMSSKFGEPINSLNDAACYMGVLFGELEAAKKALWNKNQTLLTYVRCEESYEQELKSWRSLELCPTCKQAFLCQCGEPDADGEPSMDCLLCQSRDKCNELAKELDKKKFVAEIASVEFCKAMARLEVMRTALCSIHAMSDIAGYDGGHAGIATICEQALAAEPISFSEAYHKKQLDEILKSSTQPYVLP